ncbi:hypothetical protein DVK44_16110 [Streptomyces paludis]|uniref:DUF4440 domain-containing protein n=1 Tax=Streptomyces paludis TaxID=2282738 RepID=A0A345HQJ5_9ACTN|nr:hypothetical protein DVK44_16110 [Streptomyces paludis]
MTVGQDTKDLFRKAAGEVLERRTAALLDGESTRGSADGPVHISTEAAAKEDSAVAKLSRFRDELAEAGEVYASADIETEVHSVTVSGATATVGITETTTLAYKGDRGAEPPSTAFQAKHTFVYDLGSDGTWSLISADPVDEGGPAAVNQVAGTPT